MATPDSPRVPHAKRRPSLTAGADRAFMFLAGLVLLACLATVAAGACLLVNRFERHEHWKPTSGVVTRHIQDEKDDKGAVYVELAFSVPGEGEYASWEWTRKPADFPIGARFAMRYNPELTRVAMIDGFASLFGLPIALMSLGAAMAVASLLFGRMFYRNYQKRL